LLGTAALRLVLVLVLGLGLLRSRLVLLMLLRHITSAPRTEHVYTKALDGRACAKCQ